MKWSKDSDESNIEDRRGQRGGGGGGPRLPGGKLSLGGIVILLIGAFLGKDLLGGGGGGGQGGGSSGLDELTAQGGAGGSDTPYQASPEEQRLYDFSVHTFNDVQRFWADALPAAGAGAYRDARFVIFTEATRSGCGDASAEIGPFYCPADDRVYIDLTFYAALSKRLGAPGDFAQAYVIAHEIGHHIQNLRGDNARVEKAARRSEQAGNEMSIRLELQADCLAGVWAHGAERRDKLEPGDVEESLGAATAVGDDRLQKMGGGRVNRETWTHGSSAQRVKWFKTGMASGRLADCDTFAVAQP